MVHEYMLLSSTTVMGRWGAGKDTTKKAGKVRARTPCIATYCAIGVHTTIKNV